MIQPKFTIGDKVLYQKAKGYLMAVIVSGVFRPDGDGWEYRVSIDSNNTDDWLNTDHSTKDADGFVKDYVVESKVEAVYSNSKEVWVRIKSS